MFGNKIGKIEALAAKKKGDDLAAYLTDKDPAVRLAAVKGLGEAGGEAAFNNLTSLLRSPDASMRKAAAGALEVLKDSKAAAFINARLREEPDADVKAAMQRAQAVLHDKA